MNEHVLTGLCAILALGVTAQWIAWRIRLPSILLLLLFGFIAGPLTGFIRPDEILGDVLLPLVSISVAVILFEGGLSLRFSDLKGVGKTVRNLVSVGALVTWVVTALASVIIFGLQADLAILLGAVLIVSGPTVILPVLRHLRLKSTTASILRWEGIVIDPIGAVLAVLVFEGIASGELHSFTLPAVTGFIKMIGIGLSFGIVFAMLLILLLKKFWIPDFLQEAVSLMLVIAAYSLSNRFQSESGLLSATVMGVALANQRLVPIKQILEFEENMRVLLIAVLFIILSARIELSPFIAIGFKGVIFLAALILVARPAAVFIATITSSLPWKERLFLSWMAPRGIVAAAVSSVFAIRLTEIGHPQAELLVPLTFLVIVGTVAIYGLCSAPLARKLKVAHPDPQGCLIVGAHSWARDIALILKAENMETLLIDANRQNINKARMAGLKTFYGDILSEKTRKKIELDGIGRLIALTPNHEVNSLAVLRYIEIFGSAEVYQLQAADKNKSEAPPSDPMHGRFLFSPGVDYNYINDRIKKGAVIKKINLTEEFDYKEFQNLYGNSTVNLCRIDKNRRLLFFTIDDDHAPSPGETIISLADDAQQKETRIEQP